MFLRGQDSEDENNRGSQVTNIYKKRKKEDKSAQLESDIASESINDNIMLDVPKDNQNSKNSLLPSEKVLSQTMFETIPDEIGNAKEIEINNNQHVTGEMEINEQNNTQPKIDKMEVEERRNEQMSYSGTVKKSMPKRRKGNLKKQTCNMQIT
ncbi:hypothetical protein C2G38_2038007 [Gigaspora rosea]|uniref:Uncharacterized protein n=1 Tax=Gigaspora rosea TaxID=44941 RepID=A0A397V703_9GLOM|nr:hypothetical protein C2G38_2038007 [Gigaspora rosea]